VSAVRDLMAGRVDWTGIGWVLLSAVVLTAVFAPITMRLYRTRT